VDLDGTLIRSDVSYQALLGYIGSYLFGFIDVVSWLLIGHSTLKAELAKKLPINVSLLPYNEEVIKMIELEQFTRKIVLATASHRIYADQVSSYLGYFDQVMATEGDLNLAAKNKRDALIAAFGEKGFDYMGNSHDDLIVWQAARKAYLVNPEHNVEFLARKQGNVESVVSFQKSFVHSLIKAVHFTQWFKNSLIILPLLVRHHFQDYYSFLYAFYAFLFFGFAASSIILFYDLLYIEEHRKYPLKQQSPFALGDISLKTGIILVPLLLFTALLGSLLLFPWQFTIFLGAYCGLQVIYSFNFKNCITINIFTIIAMCIICIIVGYLYLF
jgi:hypothetical protein